MLLRYPPRLFAVLPALAALHLAAGCLAPDAVPREASGGGPTGGGGAGGETSGGGAGGGGAPSLGLAWARSYGLDSDNDQRAWSVSATADGGVILAGEFEGSLTLGALPTLPNTAGRDAFVARFDPDGHPVALTGLAGLGDQRAFRVVATPDGGFVVAGAFTQSLVLAGVPQGGTPVGEAGFVASLDDQQALRWLVPIDGPGFQAVHALALAPDGGVFIAGYFDEVLALGDTVVEGDTETLDFFVAKLDSAGAPVWATSLGGDPALLGAGQPTCHLAAAPDGGVHVAGTFMGTVRLDENLGAVGARDLFVARLDPSGNPVWGHTLGAPGEGQRAASIAVDAAGRTLLAGDLTGQGVLAGVTLQSDGPEPDAFLALFDEAGAAVWARRFGSVAEDHADAVAFDAAGDIFFTGRFRGAITFGAEAPLLNAQAAGPSDDIFVAKLTPDAAPIVSRAFGRHGHQIPTTVAAGAQDDLFLAGYFSGVVDFGGGDLDALLGDDIFVVKLEP